MAIPTIRRRPPNSTRNKRGCRPDLLDRRQKVLALRARGLSFAEIAKRVGTDKGTAWRDYITVADAPDSEVTNELAREQLLAAHAELIGCLMADLDVQAECGQIEELRGPDGQVLNAKVKRWISPQTAAECGRALQRVAVLMGLSEVNPDQAAAGSQTTNITLLAPGDPAQFGARARELADALQAAPAVEVVAEHVPEDQAPVEAPPGATQPRPRVIRRGVVGRDATAAP